MRPGGILVGMSYFFTDHLSILPLRHLVFNSVASAAITIGGVWMEIDWILTGGSLAKVLGAGGLVLFGVYLLYRAWGEWAVYARRPIMSPELKSLQEHIDMLLGANNRDWRTLASGPISEHERLTVHKELKAREEELHQLLDQKRALEKSERSSK